MSYTIYEGDYQEVKVPNVDMPWIPGEFLLRMVMYCAKRKYADEWFGVLDNGEVIPIVVKKKHNLRRVGELCRFHYELSQAISLYLKRQTNAVKIKNIMDNRKRNIWTKEERTKAY